jgi:hypothetical protein
MAKRTITLVLDELDYDAIQNEFAKMQAIRDEDGPLLPDGESNLEGGMVAEIVRELNAYRSIWEAEHPRSEP